MDPQLKLTSLGFARPLLQRVVRATRGADALSGRISVVVFGTFWRAFVI